jgi:hypothetical protein
MSFGNLSRDRWTVDYPEVRGVFIGGCVERGVGSKFRAKAHAHTGGSSRGWICFRSERWLSCRELWLHEVAHVVTREGHTDRWRAFLLQLGGTLDEVRIGDNVVLGSYQKRQRRPRAKVVERGENEDGRFVVYDNGAVTMWPHRTAAAT